ncbi:hypothetical protein O7608_21515 [Solwaraspora sp. WMMA2056]|uniref:hypothetical protein n=1 Tax=Solwaraspora sp. WMMA2056 TaxID=3015161 RepID=UPI00259B28D9|nr:hypothetical protein [Solwaraspora sp. WMMA2056]WJK39053.1 hypothetical protein O7608_21515 [Solwaraspora sp. WMMA2056]
MDPELFPERAAHRPGPIITGHVVRLEGGYSRPIKVGQPILIGVLAAAGVPRVLGAALATLRLAGSGSTAARRKWKQLRTGPEFLVTPLHIRDTSGVLCEMEIHGHVPQSALDPSDHVQVTVRRQKDPELPPRVERIVNLTTGQFLTPRTPTVWSHLGPALLFQAFLGVLVVAAIAGVVLALR